MPVVCIGTDIVSISRITAVQARWGLRFAQKILTEKEIHQYILARQSSNFLAKRFAAKEACLKALGTGVSEGVGFLQIIIGHSARGQPIVHLTDRAARKADAIGAHNWLISLSDDGDYAVAYVLATV